MPSLSDPDLTDEEFERLYWQYKRNYDRLGMRLMRRHCWTFFWLCFAYLFFCFLIMYMSLV